MRFTLNLKIIYIFCLLFICLSFMFFNIKIKIYTITTTFNKFNKNKIFINKN